MEAQQASSAKKSRGGLLKNRWSRWLIVFIGSSILVSLETENPIVPFLLVYAILYPSFAFVMAVIKILRFNFFPSPLQLWKGFRRQWETIERGPVVVRVHRKKLSST